MVFKEDPKDLSFMVPRVYLKRHKGVYVMSVVFVSLLGLGYIIFRTSTIFATPDLTIDFPRDGEMVHGATVSIRGTTDPKVRMTINGYETYSDPDGKFDVRLPFQAGFHIVDIRATNRIGKESKVVRRIVVE